MGKRLGFAFALLAAGLITVEASTISGVVKESDAAGAAVESAVVQVSLGGGKYLTDTTDVNGAYSVTGATAGDRKIKVSKTGYASGADTVTVDDTTAAYTADLYLTLQTYSAVSGAVTDTSTGTGLAGAQVILQAGTGSSSIRDTAFTDNIGAFSFADIAAGNVILKTTLNGYTSKSTSVTVTASTAPVSIALAPVQFGSILGTVTDSAAGTAVSGAAVILRKSSGTGGGAGGSTPVDTFTTGTDGTYLFADVESGSYSVKVTMTDYVSKTVSSLIVEGSGADTANVALVKITLGSIAGKVSSDSLNGKAVEGVSVILSLSSGTGAGGAGTALDTAITDVNGNYSFENVASGSKYRVSASMTGYESASASVNNKSAGIDTANIVLVKSGSGTVLVFVKKSADSTAVAGASVTGVISSSATPLTGVSGTDGSLTFTGIVISGTSLNVALTATLSGYTAVTEDAYVPKNGSDTVIIYMAVSAEGTKVLHGAVSDLSTALPLANAVVTLTVTTGGKGNAELTLIDTTGADGVYLFDNLPVSSTSGSIVVALSGYKAATATNKITLGAVNTADTTALNVNMNLTIAVLTGTGAHAKPMNFNILRSGVIEFNNITENGIVKIFTINGKVLFQSVIYTHTRYINLPDNITSSGKALIVSVRQGTNISRNEILVP